ncbi:BICD family-like cargo adapter 1 isoform X2 [Tubulanus polymorphus]|uniref:BICD family-like cargo adapter 1 isoform X2 n=1 Tax=Tubulanus polymorphus TaxID=672921 RepID=UPI003DA5FD52
MCACHLGVSSTPSTPENLEDYYQYLDMEERQVDPDDVYAQLAQKEKDLFLAAEIGQSLLEKNKELQRKNEHYESIHKDLQLKIDDLEQERYRLRLRLESAEGEYENTIKDLQTDIEILRKKLGAEQQNTKLKEDDKTNIVKELRAQNERLTDQLKKSLNAEESLNTQLTGLRLQVSSRRSSIQSHVSELTVLREEITILTERVRELDRRIKQLSEERDAAVCNCEEAQDRIMMLERQKMEQDQQIRSHERELIELRETNSDLQEKLEELSLHASSTSGGHYNNGSNNNSLFNELEMSNCFSEDMELGRPQSGMSGMKLGGAYPMSPSPGLSLDDDDDDIEYDDDYIHIEQAPPSGENNHQTFQLEVFEVYQQIKDMFQQLKQQQDTNIDQSPEQKIFAEFEKGSLSNLLLELHSLMDEMAKRQANAEKVNILEEELTCTQSQVRSLHMVVTEKDDELKKKSHDLMELTQKITIQELQIEQQKQSNITLEKDKSHDEMQVDKEDIVSLARLERDEAITKRNSMEVELANAKLDLAKLDQQLLESIQQKIELSQQLEQCQLDMQELLQRQISKRVVTELEADDKLPPKTERKKKHFWH